MNKKLLDQPNHGHYPYCMMRKKQIEKTSARILAVTVISGGIMLLCTFLGIPLGIFSAAASAVSGGSYIAFLIISWLEILLIVFLAVMNFFRSKAYGILLFLIYAALSISVLHSGERTPVGMIPLVIGVAGVIAAHRAVQDLADQRQLELTEGYPFFSEIYTELTENPDYTSRYEDARNPGTLRRIPPKNSDMQELSAACDSCDLPDSKSEPVAMNDLFAPAEKPEQPPQPSPEIIPEAEPEPEEKPEQKIPGEKYVKKYEKSILEESTSLFDDDYELPSIKPLYFQRLEEEKKQQE
ncbi:MAG: hypothetical protein J6K77_06065 [Ruminococcus sp.]|nr:hypothetical protein [Ruminococcus sp.]